MVWKQSLRLLGNATDAEDCLQAVMLEAFELSERQEVYSWPGLLRRLAIVRSLGRLRARYRERIDPRPIDEISLMAGDAPAHALLEANDLAESLRFSLTKLTPRQAEAFSLKWFDNLSNEEIAQRMQISANHVAVLLHRARHALHTLLVERWEVHHESP